MGHHTEVVTAFDSHVPPPRSCLIGTYGFGGGPQAYAVGEVGKRRRLASDEMRERYGERFDP